MFILPLLAAVVPTLGNLIVKEYMLRKMYIISTEAQHPSPPKRGRRPLRLRRLLKKEYAQDELIKLRTKFATLYSVDIHGRRRSLIF